MADDVSTVCTRESWTDRALEYAEEHGWKLVPLQANSKSSPSYSDDPVERHLGCFVLVDVPEEATSDPATLRDLGVEFPVALIGAVTGRASSLLAVEIERSGPKTDLTDQIESLAGDAPRILGPHREYLLFQHPDTHQPLPTHTKKEGILLHGEDSVIRLPWRYYQWSLDLADTPPLPDGELLSLFGLSSVGSQDPPERPDEHDSPEHTERHPEDGSDDVQLDLPLESRPANGHATTPGTESLFRSGEELRPGPDDEAPLANFPWLVPGGLSLLTGRSKTAGKSTWALNLALHLAAGRPFLDAPSSVTDVVAMTDASPTCFWRRLKHIGLVGRETLARLHVLHPGEVRDLDWRSTLSRAYDHVESVGAGLLVIDCLDRYVRLKRGGDPRGNEEVVHALTAEPPPGCAVLGIKSLDCSPREPLSQTINRLDLLGLAADVILRLDDVSTNCFPSLRRLRAVSAAGTTPGTVHCAMRQSRCQRVQRSDSTELPLHPTGLRAPPSQSARTHAVRQLMRE